MTVLESKDFRLLWDGYSPHRCPINKSPEVMARPSTVPCVRVMGTGALNQLPVTKAKYGKGQRPEATPDLKTRSMTVMRWGLDRTL